MTDRRTLVTMLVVLATAGRAASQDTRRLSADEAVRLALENNLGIQVARLNPQLQDLSVAQAQAAWVPTLTSTVQTSSTDTPNTSFLSGSQGNKTTDKRTLSNLGVTQLTPWGGSYSVGWDASRTTTTNIFSNFSPQLRSSLSVDLKQPLLKNWKIDSTRQQVMVSQKNREIADLDTAQTVATTSRAVRNAYWDLAYALASATVQRQSLELAQQSLRETNQRIQIGTTPPIDAVAAQAEVAQREEAVIVAEAAIDTAQDALRALIFNPTAPDFWTTRIEPSDPVDFTPIGVDVDGAVRRALEQRTDLQQTRKSLETSAINIRFSANQTLPDVTAVFDYGLTGLGGRQFLRGSGFPGPIVGSTDRGFGSVLGDLFQNQFPTWTLGVNVSYPVGRSQQEAALARLKLQSTQVATQLRNAELQVVTQVRTIARQVMTNQKRVDSTRASRALAEQRLDAEQRKLAVGTSTSFVVFQAQRDLAQAKNNELNAILDYNRSVIDLDTVQRAPIGASTGSTGATTPQASFTAQAAGTTGAGATTSTTTAAATGATATGGAPGR